MSVKSRSLASYGSEGVGLNALLILLVLIGVVTTVAGTIGDLRGWWGDKPFLTNLASAVAGAGFGIPFAVVILRKLLARQQAIDEWAARRRSSRQPLEVALVLLTRLAQTFGREPASSNFRDFEAASARWRRWVEGEKPYIWIQSDMTIYPPISSVIADITLDMAELLETVEQLKEGYDSGGHTDRAHLGKLLERGAAFARRLTITMDILLAMSRLEASDDQDLRRQLAVYLLPGKVILPLPAKTSPTAISLADRTKEQAS